MRKSLVIAAMLLLMTLSACAGTAHTPATPTPDALDLSGTGLTDIAYLQEYTWLRSLDLRDNPIAAADYDALQSALPECDIRWSVPFAGRRLDSGVSYIDVESFTDADADALAYFPTLDYVDGRGCGDTAALCRAAKRYPDVDFTWFVRLGAQTVKNDAAELDLSDEGLTAAALHETLPLLPALTRVHLGDTPLSDAERLALMEAFPSIDFLWSVELLPGVFGDNESGTLDLRGNTVTDVDALIQKLRLLPGLTMLDMCECGPSNAEMMRVREAFPDTKVVWMVDAGGYRVRTDIRGFSTGVITRFPNGGGYRTGEGGHGQKNGEFDDLCYCTDLEALDIGHCTKITDISFVARLPKLKYLIVAMTYVESLEPLRDQTELIYLEIFDCYSITDITPLRNCKKIRYLNCSAANFTEIDTILGFKQLERLWITDSELSDAQLGQIRDAFPNALINDARDRYAADHKWRAGNWGYVDMQRLYGMRAQFQGGISPTPELAPTPTPQAD